MNVAAAAEPQGAGGPALRLVLAATSLSAAVGIAVVSVPEHAALIALAVVVAAVAVRAPAAVFAASLLLLAYAPESLGAVAGVLGRPELQKAALYLAVLPLLLSRGVQPKLVLPIVAYAALATLSVLHGQLAPGLDIPQMVSTFVTLTVGWAVLAVKWQATKDVGLLKIVAALPLVCVVLGAVLQAAGLHATLQDASSFDAVTRLRGASIPSQLGMLSFIASVAALACWRITRWKPALALLLADVLILAATASRGAALALAIAMLWPALRYGLGSLRSAPRLGAARLCAMAALVALVAVTLIPRLQARNAGGRYYAGHGTVSDPTSGREAAWQQFYDIAQQSPLFGHGLGAGPITQISQAGFQAQHNEYLRFFLEGGYIGGGLVLAAIVVVVVMAVAGAPRSLRIDLAGAAVALALLSYTDNTLNSVMLIVPFCLLIGICASLGRDFQLPAAGRPAATPASAGSR